MPWFRRRRYAVPGVTPTDSHGGWDAYDGTRLADRPAVRAVLAQAPPHFADLVFTPGDPDMALTREELLANVTVATADGLSWTLSLGEEIKAVVDTGPDVFDDDLVLAALTARPEVARAEHPDREVYEMTLSAPMPADEMLALSVAALTAAHRELARRLRVELPG
ncbi:hypothetical protein OG799_23260 [Micromonospora sp. NBC_00898]|uniref:hypothetical protein n=1 Tax=Micromonospora sp. NBC_00898 TaxID=2975981 RepID=UPI00386C63E2|nr:hypothetical protein OG799_23260 [Micromonospora sp. NBC_00898]